MILAFVGVKMLIAEWVHIPTWVSLVVIAVVLIAAITLSWRFPGPTRGGGRRVRAIP